jgi:hypothetical protein
MGDGADLGDVGSTTMEGVVDREEVFGGKIIDPGDLERLAAASLDERSEGARAVTPHAGRRDVAMDLGVDLLHGNSEGAFAVVDDRACSLGEWEGIDEGWQLQRVEHGGGLAWCVWPGRLRVVHRHLGERALCAVEQAECGGLLQEGAS